MKMHTEHLYIPKTSNENVVKNTVPCDSDDVNTFLNNLNEIQTSLEVRNITVYCTIFILMIPVKSCYIKPNHCT